MEAKEVSRKCNPIDQINQNRDIALTILENINDTPMSKYLGMLVVNAHRDNIVRLGETSSELAESAKQAIEIIDLAVATGVSNIPIKLFPTYAKLSPKFMQLFSTVNQQLTVSLASAEQLLDILKFIDKSYAKINRIVSLRKMLLVKGMVDKRLNLYLSKVKEIFAGIEEACPDKQLVRHQCAKWQEAIQLLSEKCNGVLKELIGYSVRAKNIAEEKFSPIAAPGKLSSALFSSTSKKRKRTEVKEVEPRIHFENSVVKN